MKLLLTLALILGQAPAVRHSGGQWRAANFRGLIVGISHRTDMLRVLGQPKWSRQTGRPAEEESEGEIWNSYERVGEFPGQTTVAVNQRSGRITRINFYPERLTKEEAIAHFGRGYVVTRYAFEPCSHDEESEPLYESPDGPLVSVEYRARGIAISVGYGDLVTKISYVAGPIGAVKSRCPGSSPGSMREPRRPGRRR